MTGLLEFREKLKKFYSQNEVFILPVIKFLLAFLALSIVNDEIGYMTKLDNMAIVLIVALMCSFLPCGAIVLFAALFSLLHMYALSLEVAVVGLVVYMLLFLLFLRFSSKEALVVGITAILCLLKVPYVVPVAMGLVGTPASAVSVACGVVVYYLITTITGNATTIGTMGDTEATAKLRLIIDGLLDNKSMLVVVAAFAITVIVVYLIRRMSIDYAWSIAIIAGAMVDLVILLIGDLLYDTNVSVAGALIGAVIAVAVAKVIEFFRFCVDYSRTEKVQFEDDEYYYYVKAVPKMTVAAPTKTVKKINSTHRSSAPAGRSVSGSRPVSSGDGSSAGRPVSRSTSGRPATAERNAGARPSQGTAGRTVTTERTVAPRSTVATQAKSAYNGRRDHLSGGRSMTISSGDMDDSSADDFQLEDI